MGSPFAMSLMGTWLKRGKFNTNKSFKVFYLVYYTTVNGEQQTEYFIHFKQKLAVQKVNLSFHHCRLFRYEMSQRNRAHNRLTGKGFNIN
jgi:hypothetical protein